MTRARITKRHVEAEKTGAAAESDMHGGWGDQLIDENFGAYQINSVRIWARVVTIRVRAAFGSRRFLVTPEQLLEARRAVLPKAHGRASTRATFYSVCIEHGVLNRSQIAPNTCGRIVKSFELLKAERGNADGVRREELLADV